MVIKNTDSEIEIDREKEEREHSIISWSLGLTSGMMTVGFGAIGGIIPAAFIAYIYCGTGPAKAKPWKFTSGAALGASATFAVIFGIQAHNLSNQIDNHIMIPVNDTINQARKLSDFTPEHALQITATKMAKRAIAYCNASNENSDLPNDNSFSCTHPQKLAPTGP